jgi:hypothetical protein
MEFRLRRTSTGEFIDNSDDGNLGYIGTDIYAFNGTNNVTVFNHVYKSTDLGENWVQLADADWSERNASGTASVGGVIKLWGGNDMGGVLQDSWEFDGTTYTQISAAMTGHNRQSFAFGYKDGVYYSIGGVGQNNIISSTDLDAWTQVSALPTSLQNNGGMTACIWNGVWYIMSGQNSTSSVYPGELWKSEDDLVTLELVLTDELFEGKWNNMEAIDGALFFVRGHNSVLGGNQKGCYYCEDDPSVIGNWKRLNYEIPATHANPLLSANGKIHSFCGNMRNDSWVFERIDI